MTTVVPGRIGCLRFVASQDTGYLEPHWERPPTTGASLEEVGGRRSSSLWGGLGGLPLKP
jgi:hypothetical protein